MRTTIPYSITVSVMTLLLCACGGGGDESVTSTPTPVATATPSPTLADLQSDAAFDTLSAQAVQTLSADDGTVTASTSARAALSFSYDAASDTYTVSSNGGTSRFGPAEYSGLDDAGQAQYSSTTTGGLDKLTLLNRANIGDGTQYVSLGLWQRRDTSEDLSYDVFAYGFATEPADIPLTGSATYDITLLGVVAPPNEFVHTVLGDGTFSLDFAQGLFSLSGDATEYNNDADYWTCCHAWQGAGYLSSSGNLTGNFAYDGRYETYQGTVLATLFGPDASEVGGSVVGTNVDGTGSFSGAFAGTKASDDTDVNFSALDDGARSYYTLVGTTVAALFPGETSGEASAYYFPDDYGSVTFDDDDAITLVTGISDARYSDVTFTQADLVSSDTRFAIYETSNANGDYRLEMFQPGPDNPEIQLTYSSFGHWTETRAIGNLSEQQVSSWFSYGVRTQADTLPATGTAHFDATVLGSGTRYADMAALTVTGTTAIDIDFAKETVNGTFDADAYTSANEKIDLPTMTFSSQGNAYGFDTLLMQTPGHSFGSIEGALYGPSGEEIGGTFEFYTPSALANEADASYSGVFYGKRN
ncbi:transferrin-binding protein-like solute binding protein [Novosphingobium sp. 1949]|uniref:Transferrin-binding protein-like solute binding protein n=1 Tax=Novosphingobium organovorum TaxID=2930092 RepID=A0ABT0BDM6_9SPHN|nr:transferrin-binding protein-like solute binding protein [Novosphingobium organovorum]MCJ2183137.1 transferrin-binding protein-like solute binding protein [Novosphingobium organovorum]